MISKYKIITIVIIIISITQSHEQASISVSPSPLPSYLDYTILNFPNVRAPGCQHPPIGDPPLIYDSAEFFFAYDFMDFSGPPFYATYLSRSLFFFFEIAFHTNLK